MTPGSKQSMRRFLRQNPFPNPWTDGLFYREKMRSIHRIAPRDVASPILDIGGGSSGMLAMLYPDSRVVTLDIDATTIRRGDAASGSGSASHATVGDACRLPFPNDAFGLVALLDVIEHIEDHTAAILEARRVLRPGGVLLVTTPKITWHYPRCSPLRPHVRSEIELMEEWGHVRRGYEADALDDLVGLEPTATATFSGLLVSPFHDISFSGWSDRRRRLAYAALAIPVLVGYAIDRLLSTGEEMARRYEQPRTQR